jgi:DNA-binding response OmpR family regulator
MRKHVLIVDDEHNFCFSASLALKKAGFTVSTAYSGEEAIDLILDTRRKENCFDLMILDIQLPGISGLELIDRLKLDSVLVPILAISGVADNSVINELISRNCPDFLEKPFEPEVMLERVMAILKKQKKHIKA